MPPPVDVDGLLAEARKITDVEDLIYFFRHPEKDELAYGPLGMHLYRFTLHHTATEEDVVPRFIVVRASFYQYREITVNNLASWKQVLYDIETVSHGNNALKSVLENGVNTIVHRFAARTFREINHLRNLPEATRKALNQDLFDYFFSEIDFLIQTVNSTVDAVLP